MNDIRVTDGARTRDVRNHNPLSELRYRALRLADWALERVQKRIRARVGAPGPELVGLRARTSGGW